jgi:hypothetical protein
MRKIILIAVTLLSLQVQGQILRGNRLVLRGSTIDTVKNDTIGLSGRIKSLMTADAVYKFVNGRSMAGGGTWQNSLIAGSTLTQPNVANQNGHNFTFLGGRADNDTTIIKYSVLDLDSTDIYTHYESPTVGNYSTLIRKGGGITYRHSGTYTAGCTTCGLNTMGMGMIQNSQYPTGGTDTTLGGFGWHNGPDDKHFYIADLTDYYAGPGIPANRLVTIEKYGQAFFAAYNNPTNNNAQVIIGFYPNWVFNANYNTYRFIAAGKTAFTDTVYHIGKVGFGTEAPRKQIDVVGGDILINELTVGRGNNNISTNTAFGDSAFASIISGVRGVAIGYHSSAKITAANNTSVGAYSLYGDLGGGDGQQVAIGTYSAYSGGTPYQVSIGYKSFYSIRHALAFNCLNVGVGNETGYSSVNYAVNCTFVGGAAGYGNTAGSQNSYFGSLAGGQGWVGIGGAAAGTGNDNTGIGQGSMLYNKSASGSSALGKGSLGGSGYAPTIGYNIGLGYNSGSGITTGNYNVIIGSNTGASIATASNQIIISDGQGNERMRLDSAGQAGIGTSTPSQKLDVVGNVRFSGALMPNNIAGTTGQVLTSAGTGTVPTWTTVGGTVVSTYDQQGLTATATNAINYTTPNNGFINVYDVGCHITVTAVTAGVLTTTVTYFDETNTSRTVSFFSMGSTTSGLSITGVSNFSPMGEITAYPNTAIILTTTLTAGTATYNLSSSVRFVRLGVGL